MKPNYQEKKESVEFMKIYVKNDDGKLYEAYQINENTYTFITENKSFELSLSATEIVDGYTTLSEKKKEMTNAFF